MKAVILAAGKGTRMGGMTKERPKPMLEVEKKPILQHIIEGMASAGIKQFYIITGWKAEIIEEYFGDGKRMNVEIQYGRQVVQDGTGKAPELARQFVGKDSFLLTYGDILVEPDVYRQLIERWSEDAFTGLVTVTRSEDITKGGLFFFDKAFCLKHLVEKPDQYKLQELKKSGWIREGNPVWYNAGIYVFCPAIFEFTSNLQKSPRGEYELTDAIQAMVEKNHRIGGLEIAGRWVDVRDPEVLARLEAEAGKNTGQVNRE